MIFVWVFWLWLRPLSLFASLFFLLAKRKSGRGICVSSLLWCVFRVGSMICRDIMEPRSFMMLLICLLAYPNVRTEPQSEIGRNRGKKKVTFAALLFFIFIPVRQSYNLYYHRSQVSPGIWWHRSNSVLCADSNGAWWRLVIFFRSGTFESFEPCFRR